MLLQSFKLLSTLRWHFLKYSLEFSKLCKAALQKLHIVVSILEQGDPLTAQHLAQLLDPRLAPEPLLPAILHDHLVVGLDLARHLDKLAVKQRVLYI